MNNILSIVINIFVLIFACIGFLSSAGILFVIYYYRRRFLINPPMFLICNTYISIIFVSIILFDIYVYYIYAQINTNISFDNSWCYLRAYFLHVSVCLLYYSYLLQAIYRFIRVILYRRKRLQTLRFIFQLVMIQWLINFLYFLPFYFFKYFQYVSEYYYCEILLTDNQGMLIMGVMTYSLPMTGMTIIYQYIIYYMKKTKNQLILHNRHRTTQRDVIVLRRILIIVILLNILGLPIIIIWWQYMATGYANPIGYRLGWSFFTVSLAILPITTVFVTPQLRDLFIHMCRRQRQIHPTITQ